MHYTVLGFFFFFFNLSFGHVFWNVHVARFHSEGL